jgi:hypothetical protein
MAINPATGLEDPNYTEPEVTTADPIEGETALSAPTDTPIPTYNATQFDTQDDTLEDPTTIQPGSDFVSPESTVAGQLEKIFKAGSPLQDLAETRAKERASALGMQSSSAAIGASQRALYDTGLQIATPDAATHAAAQAREQSAKISQSQVDKEAQVAGDLTVQKAAIAQRQKSINDDFQLLLTGMEQDQQKELLGVKNEFDKSIAVLNNDLQSQLTRLSIDADIEGKIINQTHDMLNNVQISWQQMLTNDNFLNNFTDRADMLTTMNNLLNPVKASITMSAQQAGVYDSEFQSWISTLIEDSQYV